MMKHRFFTALVMLYALQYFTACSSVTEEQGAKAIAELYGGQVSISKGANATTESEDFQGKYLKVKIRNSSVEQHSNDLRMPASYSAAMLYAELTPEEQKRYDYFIVTFEGKAGTHDFKFKRPELITVNSAVTDVNSLFINLQTDDHDKIVQAFNTSVIDSANRNAVPAMIQKIEADLKPISNYMVIGSEVGEVEIAKRKTQLARLIVRVEHAGKATQVALTVNPAMHADQPFLYGLQIL